MSLRIAIIKIHIRQYFSQCGSASHLHASSIQWLVLVHNNTVAVVHTPETGRTHARHELEGIDWRLTNVVQDGSYLFIIDIVHEVQKLSE